MRNSDSDVANSSCNRDREKSAASNSSTNQWTVEEKKTYIDSLKRYGKNFQKISECLKRRTPDQCRNYFQNYKVKLNLNQYVREFERHNNTTANANAANSSTTAAMAQMNRN